MKVLKVPILIFVLLIWTVIGFLFWIPLLARTIAIYTSILLIDNITEKWSNSKDYTERLETSTRFYATGFVNIIDALYGEQEKAPYSNKERFDFGRLFVEALWCAGFWGSVILLYVTFVGTGINN